MELYDAIAQALLWLCFTLLVGHFVGDWFLQTDWMALNKSKNWLALGTHVGVWTLTMFLHILAWRFYFFTTLKWKVVVGWAFINGLVHFGWDAITSTWTSRLWFIEFDEHYDTGKRNGVFFQKWRVNLFPGKRHWFFVVIGFDQLVHYLVMFWTARLIFFP